MRTAIAAIDDLVSHNLNRVVTARNGIDRAVRTRRYDIAVLCHRRAGGLDHLHVVTGGGRHTAAVGTHDDGIGLTVLLAPQDVL